MVLPENMILCHYGPTEATDVMDQLVEVYRDARQDPEFDGPLWTREAFLDRTRSQVQNPGFELVTADLGDEVVGIAFGLPFAAGRWWAGKGTAPPPEVLGITRFAVIELDVRKAWARRGIGRALLGELLSGRPEAMAMLTTRPGTWMREMYDRWGWRKVAETESPSGPVMDTLVLPLRADAVSN
jgi:GNAT superfamily N-acetyltransferase